ncbi:SIMPL domain-containing protein [Sphingomicrobium flavum]|uniref:SIMPL domain-containing protein n=1 Tax=Sphingomicrobium flavum TaxID=1229164 RepID=UPI0021AD5F8E|nr:SIMPL domain-containing protein [Sphingomicrobium flavum]
MRIFALIPLAALAACQPAAPDPRGVDKDETLLTVSATGQSETRPDEARFSLGVETLAGSAKEASRLNAEKMERVMAALDPFDIPEDMLRTQALQLNRIDWGKDRGKYRAYNIVEVRLKAVDRAGEAVTAASDAGANVVSGPNMVVSDREAATKSAYAMAYNNARLRADAYAEAAGLRVARVLTIRDNGQSGGYRGPYPEDMVMAESAAMAPPPVVQTAPVSPGLNRDQVSVSVAFALEPAGN